LNFSSSLALGVEEAKLPLLKRPFLLDVEGTGIKLDLLTPDARLDGRELGVSDGEDMVDMR
jgi:hypothetical protein